MVLEKTLESPLDCKEIQPVHPKGDQSWVFIGRADAKAETPALWPPHAESWLIGKDPDVGRDWGQEEKGTTEDEMAEWHHRLDGHEFEWTPGVGDGQGGLVCCGSWGCKESDMIERLNWSELYCYWLNIIENKLDGTSLVIQYWRLRASTSGGTGLIPGLGTKIPQPAWHSQKKEKKMSENYWERVRNLGETYSSFVILRLSLIG